MFLIIIAVGVLTGASLIAAEINTGALGNWLTFEPRRTRVVFAKVLGVTVGIIPVGVLALMILIGGTWEAYALNDALGATTANTWTALIWMAFQPLWQPWAISVNIRGFLDRGTTYSFDVCKPGAGGPDCDWVENQLSFTHSTVFLVVLLTVLVFAAWQVFRFRDVD